MVRAPRRTCARALGARQSWQVLRGRPYPLGASWDGEGVNFALFSAHAEQVELCLFAGDDPSERARLPLRRSDDVWHCYLPGARPGLAYGYRVHGPAAPERGHRFDPDKLLLDPYARAFAGQFHWSDVHFSYHHGDTRGERARHQRDNAAATWRARVVDPSFDWGDDRAPRTPWADTVICEAHVKGYTMAAADVPAALRGTYAGLAHPAALARLRASGATAVELLPVQAFLDEHLLVTRGLVNYWGYNTIGYFAPAPRYAATDDPAREFRNMVKALHASGLEVILDVVYNHTAEGDERGPTLSWRGIDNASYYLLSANDPRRYTDLSGCGNTLNLAHPRVLQMVMDSLRFWVEDMHVDGFRFDLATALARGPLGFDAQATFLATLRQDPVLAGVKLIAEPWDVATWATGRFPPGLAEWNDRYRDAVRGFWLTGVTNCGELARRVAASDDLFRHSGRAPQASINYVTAHDGFTLADLVSYAHKHNLANGHHNHDGSADNRSINCGVEGPSDDSAIRARRQRLVRAMLATLFVSHGVPMLPAGDEHGRTQRGNNNAYCQDNALSWLDWAGADQALRAFVADAVALRASQPALRREHWFNGSPTALGEADVVWLAPHGNEMSPADWHNGDQRAFAFRLAREAADETALLVCLNAMPGALDFHLPAPPAAPWRVLLDSAGTAGTPAGAHFAVPAEALVVLGSAPAQAAAAPHG